MELSIIKVWFDNGNIYIQLSNNTQLSAIVKTFTNLSKGMPEQWAKYELWNDGRWLH